MSDALRQDTSDKATSALKPDSQKSTLETIGDKVKGAGDSAAGTVQPGEELASILMLCRYADAELEESKSATQKVSDGTASTTDQIKNTVGLGGSK